MDACKTCKAPVIWALSPAGKASPIDRDPDSEKGNVLILSPSGFGLLAVTLSDKALDQARRAHVPLRLSHWATCADRQEWRERTDANE